MPTQLHCTSPEPRFTTLPKRWARQLGVGLLVLAGLRAQAQAQTIVFNENFEGATNSFTLENGTQANRWVVGTAGGNGPTTATGTRAAYISNDAGVTNTYTLTTTSVTHLYRDVVLPAGQSAFQLSFDWRSMGEGGYDYLLVQLAPSTFVPVAGTQPAATSVTLLDQNLSQVAFKHTTIQLPGSLAGTTQRLVFTWRNNDSRGFQPPAVIDNVMITAQGAIPLRGPLSGAYTINNAAPTAGNNFASFTEAANALNLNGISGPVTLAVTGGPYTDQFLLNEVPGSSATNTIVVNGGGSTIRFASTNASQQAVVQLNGTDYTTIDNLLIDATGGTGTSGTYGYGVLLTNAADNDRITNNTINADIATVSSNFAGIAVSGSSYSAISNGNSANNLLVEGNTVNGGYYGITLCGNHATPLNTGNIVRNNSLRDFYLYGIYVASQDGARLVGNDISRPLRTNSNVFTGINILGTRGTAIEKNRIHDTFTGNPTVPGVLYGISLFNGTSTVVNNVFYNLSGNGVQYVIYNLNDEFARIYNNTITSDDQTSTSTSSTYGIFSYSTLGKGIDVANNVVNITRTGTNYGLYYSGTTAATTSNYNDIYVPGGKVGSCSVGSNDVDFATLAAWQTANASAFDANSLSVDPVLVGASTGNLTPSNVVLNNVGKPLARVTDDITGAVRGTAPDLGAYEFAPVATDLALLSLLNPAASMACFGGAEPLVVQIRNGGTAALNFATNAATVTVVATPPSGLPQTFTTTVSTGTLAIGATQSVTLPGTLNMTALGTYAFAVTATAVGDANPTNNVLATPPTRTVGVPAAGILSPAAIAVCLGEVASLALTGAAYGDMQYQSSPSANGPFTDIAGATKAALTRTVLSTTYYRVRITCNATTLYSNVSTVTVSSSSVATTNTPLTICARSSATLMATTSAGSMVRFYSTATGGTALTSATAGSYTTPVLTASTTYHAAAVSSSSESVGPPAFNSTPPPQIGHALYFTTTGPTTIASVTVYLNAGQVAGTVTIALNKGTAPANLVNGQSMNFAVPAGPATGVASYIIPLNYKIPFADQYNLLLAAATQGGLLYDNAGVNTTGYPFTSPSRVLSITAASVPGYCYFYNWQLVNECESATRTPIVVNVTTVPATLMAASQANGAVLLTAGPVAGATYQFFRNGVAVGTASTTNTLLLQNGLLNDSYTVVVTSAGCVSAPSAAVAVTVTGTRTAMLNGVSLHVYPNPTPDGSLTLELAGPQAKASQLTVLNSLGQVVHTRLLPAGTAKLSLAHLAAGVYTLQVQTPEGILTQRIVRE